MRGMGSGGEGVVYCGCCFSESVLVRMIVYR